MRRFLVGALVVGAAAGCGLTRPAPPAAAAASRVAADADVLYLDVALIEVPPGDPFVTHELWELGDEQGVALDTKPLLEDNGLRVCQVGGLLPERLQALLSSRRSCPSPRRLRAEPGQPTPVQVGPRRGRCAFRFRGAGGDRAVDVADARGLLEVVPSWQDDGSLRLRFAPRLAHGQARAVPEVDRDPAGALRWAMQAREAVEDFPELRWELLLRPNEYVAVGARDGGDGTLGEALFAHDEDDPPRQRLLVLRATRAGGAAPPGSLQQAPPVALRAGSR